MEEQYYRDIIEKVQSAQAQYQEILYNEYDMRDPIGDGLDYFSKLWNIINDEELNFSPKTYFEALSICLGAFYGERQDPLPVWENICKRYKKLLLSPEKTDSFTTAFLEFLNDNDGLIPTMELFYELIHLAIETQNLEIAKVLLWKTPTEIECLAQIEDIYENNPEWAAYIECLSDIHYEKLPDSPIFEATVKRLHSSFGDLPGMEKLNNLYHRHNR